jgi:hypothetical protein
MFQVNQSNRRVQGAAGWLAGRVIHRVIHSFAAVLAAGWRGGQAATGDDDAV